MSLTKKQRQIVWDKSGGKCWYCGCDLPERGWHADHVEAVGRAYEWKKDDVLGYKIVKTGKQYNPQNDNIDNIVPACAPCNLFKFTFGIEAFRREIAAQVERARRSSVNFRTAERFGLIKPTDIPVVFWFERQGMPAAPADWKEEANVPKS